MGILEKRKSGFLRKRIAYFAAVLLLVLSGSSFSVYADREKLDSYRLSEEDYGPMIKAETYCVINGRTNEVIISRGMKEKRYPASTTKVLTALIVCEKVQDLNAKLTFTATSVNIDPSSSTLNPKASAGEEMRVIDVLHGMMLQSGNECGAMLGEYVAGSEAEFAKLMNQKAAEIGCINSHFMNAYGIHNDEHYTCAYDLCLILQAAMKNPVFRTIMNDTPYVIPATNMNAARTMINGHAMLNGNIEEEGIIGGKTGATPQAGRTLVTACERDGVYTISALMKTDTENMYTDEAVLLEYAYGYANKTIRSYNVEITDDVITPKENVRIRYSPSLKSGVAGTFDAGTTMERIGTYRGWSLIEYKDRLCYVSSSFVNEVKPEETTEETNPDETEESDPTEETDETDVSDSEETEDTSASDTEDTEEITKDTEDEPSSEEDHTDIEVVPSEEDTPDDQEENGDQTDFQQIFQSVVEHLIIILPILILIVVLVTWLSILISHYRKKKARRNRLKNRKKKEE